MINETPLKWEKLKRPLITECCKGFNWVGAFSVDENGKSTIHHWICRDCEKITQVRPITDKEYQEILMKNQNLEKVESFKNSKD
jgi:Fe2+ or Zn2+ uptake regulation protein